MAAYAFTTQTINAGYFQIKGEKIQVLDVPGSLARREKMNLIELQAELVLEELAEAVIVVFDLSGYGGYSAERQEQLLKKLGRNKKVLIYLSKLDLTPAEVLEEFRHRYYSVEELRERIGQLAAMVQG